MASYQLIAPLALLTLDAGCTVTVEAIDPDTGANVSGVTVSQVAIYASNAADAPIVSEEIDHYFVFSGDEI